MATKRTAKKAPAKKAAKNTANKRAKTAPPTDPSRIPDLVMKSGGALEDLDDAFSKSIDEALENIETKSKGAIKFMTAAQLRRTIIPVPSLAFQYVIGARGIRRSTITEIISDEGLGKTTLLMLFAGWFGVQGCMGQYMDCESKAPDTNRLRQTLSRVKKTAALLLKRNMLTFSDSPTVAQITKLMPTWAREMRGKADENPFTAGKPIMSYVDLWSAALTSSEASGGWLPDGAKPSAKAKAPTKEPVTGAEIRKAKFAKKAGKKLKVIGEGSKPDHAKDSHEYFRRLKPVMNLLNWNVFITNQRNDKMSMSGGGGPAPAARLNETVRGGRALKQGAALRLTLTRTGRWESKGGGPDHGHYMEMHCLKNSYGWPGRSCIVRHRTDNVGATEDKYAETFSFAESDCELLLEKGLFGIKLDSGLYSSSDLGLSNLRPEDFYEHIWAHPDIIERAGSLLGIPGYGEIGTNVVEEVEMSGEEQDDPDELAEAMTETPEESEEETTESEEQADGPPSEDQEQSE